ncbi:hypothetical protein CGCF413_v015509 [Colletotrichum fructicola]|nr:hypothetical protein CGCF413_v015509 [Colletotrichum fructicola]
MLTFTANYLLSLRLITLASDDRSTISLRPTTQTTTKSPCLLFRSPCEVYTRLFPGKRQSNQSSTREAVRPNISAPSRIHVVSLRTIISIFNPIHSSVISIPALVSRAGAFIEQTCSSCPNHSTAPGCLLDSLRE